MYDIMRSHASLELTREVTNGHTVDREGVVLVSVLEDGREKVQKCEGKSPNERPVGWARSDNQTIDTRAQVYDTVVPKAPGPFVIQVDPYIVGALGSSSVRIHDNVTNADLTEVAAAPAATQFSVNYTTGQITFNTADATHSITIYLRNQLTVRQSKGLYYQRNINNGAGASFNVIGMMHGIGELWTNEYDTNKDWSSVAPGNIKTGPDGTVTVGGAGAELPMQVIGVPSSDNPMLGLAFNFPRK